MTALNDRALEVIKKLNARLLMLEKNQIILAFVFAALFLYLDSAFLFSAQMKAISKTGPQIKKLKSDIVSLDKDLAQIRKAQADTASARAVNVENRVLLSADQIPGLLKDIAALANKNSIKIMEINALDTAAQAGPRSPQAAPPAGGIQTDLFLISIEMITQYHGLATFLSDTFALAPVIALRSLNIINDSNDFMVQKVKISLVTNVKK